MKRHIIDGLWALLCRPRSVRRAWSPAPSYRYWYPRRLTLDIHPRVHRWLWFVW